MMNDNKPPARVEPEVGSDPQNTAPTVAAPQMSKTPMFQAIHAQRYQRQASIKAIATMTGRRLICYVSGIATATDVGVTFTN